LIDGASKGSTDSVELRTFGTVELIKGRAGRRKYIKLGHVPSGDQDVE